MTGLITAGLVVAGAAVAMAAPAAALAARTAMAAPGTARPSAGALDHHQAAVVPGHLQDPRLVTEDPGRSASGNQGEPAGTGPTVPGSVLALLPRSR